MMKPNGETINFATKPVCPECGGEIPTNEIAVEKDSAHCPTCGRVMSFAEVADYSLVMAKRKESLPPGFSVTSDSGSSLTLSFKSARIGLRLFGVVFAILFAIPIPWAIYHLLAGHCSSYSFGIGFIVSCCSWKPGCCFAFKTSGSSTWFSYSVPGIAPTSSSRPSSSRVLVNTPLAAIQPLGLREAV